MKIPFLYLRSQYQSIRNEIDIAVTNILNQAAFIGGPIVTEFEQEFANFCGTSYCIGVGNGTDALFIALRTLGIGPGDEVITAANSFIASSEAITMTGASVVFADCDPKTYCIDVAQIAIKITERTKAIIPVHLYGCPANMPAIIQLAKAHNLFVVEDAAQAHGASINGKEIGSWGDVACFSFYPGKNLGAYGDAGAIVTNSDELAKKIRMFANHGRISKYEHELEGVNSRLDALQAAILKVKLTHLKKWINQRRAVANYYCELLANTDLVLPQTPADFFHTYHLFVVRVENRETIIQYLREKGIDTGVHYPISLPFLKAYQYLNHKPENFLFSFQFQSRLLSLPMYPELTDLQIEYVCEQLICSLSSIKQTKVA